MTRWAMVMDVRRCTGCQACSVACKAENEVPLGVFRPHVRYYELGKYPNVRRPGGPRIFGDLDDPDSEVSRLVATQPVTTMKPGQGTKPQVFYIGVVTTMDE